MSLFNLAYRNTWRHSKRSILTILAVSIAVASVTFMDAYLAGAMNNLYDTYIRMETGHIKIMPEKAVKRVRPLPLDEGVKNASEIVAFLDNHPLVESASARIRFGVLLDGKDGVVPAMGTAMKTSREGKLTNPADWLIEGELPGDDKPEVILGEKLAEKMGLSVGEDLFFVTSTSYGGLGPGLYKISGIIRSGINSLDQKTFIVSLPEAQYQLAMEDSALEIALAIVGGRNMSYAVADSLENALEGAGYLGLAAVPWQEQGYLYENMSASRSSVMIMMLLMGVIALTTVVNTVLMSVMERVRELGALRALGFDRGVIIRMVITEAMIVGVIGTIIGVALGMAISLWLNKTGIDFTELMQGIDFPMDPIIYPSASWGTAMKSGVFGVVISLIAAWYPARTAVRLEPARALSTHQ